LGFGLVYFSIFAGVRVVCVCVLVYVRTYTQTTWVLDVSPGVGLTPGEPEESRSTKAQYTCRLTISKSQSLTSVRIEDCTLRVPNETIKLFLLRVIIKAIFIHTLPCQSQTVTLA